MKLRMRWMWTAAWLLSTGAGAADLDAQVSEVESRIIEHRRHFHQHPELSNREFETAQYIARELRRLGIEVHTGVAKTGVVGVLRGAKPGPVIALRADMDALPVVEEVDLPFKSTVTSSFDGKDVGVMHACGHDAHMAILLGVAELLSGLREDLAGTVKFIFQPAEEGAPDGEEGGAHLMVAEGVLSQDPKPEVIFGLHAFPIYEVGQVGIKSGGALASSDELVITVRGKQTHGAAPWQGIDPIVVASQIITALQTIPSRQMNLIQAPVIVTIGKIEGGVRNNIIPDEVVMKGTLRALDTEMRRDLHERVRRTVIRTAESAGATATVSIGEGHAYPVTVNDPKLAARMRPALVEALGEAAVVDAPPSLGAEDFSFYANEIPGLFLFLGVRTAGQPGADWAANHSPRFRLDEDGLAVGVKALTALTLNYAGAPATAP